MKHVVMEADEVLVPIGDLEAARAGSNEAKVRLRAYCRGITLYMHILGYDEGDGGMEKVGIRELSKLGVIESVRIER